MRKKCSSDREKLLKFKAEFIQTVKGQNDFLTCYWRFLISNELEQLELKLEKITGIQKYAGKLKVCF